MNYEKTKKRNKLLFIALLLMISLGYALLNANLKINGTSKINNSTWDIHWDNVEVTSGSVLVATGDKAAVITTGDSTEVTYEVSLEKPGDFYEFTVDAVNEGSVDAMIDVITSTYKIGEEEATTITSSSLPSYLDYSVSYSDGIALERYQELNAGDTETYKVRVEYKRDIENNQLVGTDQSIVFSFAVNYIQRDNNAKKVRMDFTNQTVNSSYSHDSVTKNVTLPTDGTGTYTYAKASGEEDITVSSDGVITIPAEKAVGRYTVVITATDTGTGVSKNATYTINIQKADAILTCENQTFNNMPQTACSCDGGTLDGDYQATNIGNYTAGCIGDSNHNDAPNQTWTMNKKTISPVTNLSISKNGVVSWTNSEGASGYQISTDNTNWTLVPAGVDTTSYNYLNNIIGETGNRTVYVRAINTESEDYINSDAVNTSTRVYVVNFNVNDDNYGEVSPSTINVIAGEIYSTNENIITLQDGREVSATPKTAETGYINSFQKWSRTYGTIWNDTTITATFINDASLYNITYDANGGNFEDTSTTNNVEYRVTIESGSRVVTTESGTYEEPTLTNKVFTKWNTKSDGKGVDIESADELYKLENDTATLYAQYRDPVVIFAPGETFNPMIKEMAGNTGATKDTVDSNITNFRRYTGEVNQTLLNNATIVSSDDSEGEIHAWFDNGIIYWYSPISTVYLNSNSSYMFASCSNLLDIDADNLATNNVENISSMFYDCDSIVNLDLSSWTMNNIRHAEMALSNMNNLKEINLNGWNARDGNFQAFLSSTPVLQTVKMDDWVVRDSNSFGGFFDRSGVKYLSAKNWEIASNINNWINYFCLQSIEIIDVTGWQFNEYVDSLYGLFDSCTTLKNIIGLETWDTSNITNMDILFANCSSLEEIDLSNWNTSKVRSMNNMFHGTSSLAKVNLDNFNLRSLNAYNMGGIFSQSLISELSCKNWKLPANFTNWLGRYASGYSVTKIDVTGWDLSTTTSISGLFSDAANLKTIVGLDSWDTSNIVNMSELFKDCSKITTLDLSFWDTSNVTDMSSMFKGCSILKTIYADETFVTNNTTTSTDMFTGATLLVGGNGTVYDANHIDKEYARLDDTNPGYFTSKPYYTITYDANGGEFSNNSIANTVKYRLMPTIAKYSHTANVNGEGKQIMNYGKYWNNSNIRGTDRGNTSKAHVVSIPNANNLKVELYYNGESVSYDWVSVWAGNYPNYTASSNYDSTGKVTTAMGAGDNNNKFGGIYTDSYTVNGNSLTNVGHVTLTIPGDTVTFGFISDRIQSSQGYGYYAIITSDDKLVGVGGAYEESNQTDKVFVGWNTEADGTGISVLDESDLLDLPDINVTLYAQYIDQ